MTQDELTENVKARLSKLDKISVVDIQTRYRCLHSQARKCIRDLQAEGLISREWNFLEGGYLVLKQEGGRDD
jgi:ribosomal protein S25